MSTLLEVYLCFTLLEALFEFMILIIIKIQKYYKWKFQTWTFAFKICSIFWVFSRVYLKFFHFSFLDCLSWLVLFRMESFLEKLSIPKSSSFAFDFSFEFLFSGWGLLLTPMWKLISPDKILTFSSCIWVVQTNYSTYSSLTPYFLL